MGHLTGDTDESMSSGIWRSGGMTEIGDLEALGFELFIKRNVRQWVYNEGQWCHHSLLVNGCSFCAFHFCLDSNGTAYAILENLWYVMIIFMVGPVG